MMFLVVLICFLLPFLVYADQTYKMATLSWPSAMPKECMQLCENIWKFERDADGHTIETQARCGLEVETFGWGIGFTGGIISQKKYCVVRKSIIRDGVETNFPDLRILMPEEN